MIIFYLDVNCRQGSKKDILTRPRQRHTWVSAYTASDGYEARVTL